MSFQARTESLRNLKHAKKHTKIMMHCRTNNDTMLHMRVTRGLYTSTQKHVLRSTALNSQQRTQLEVDQVERSEEEEKAWFLLRLQTPVLAIDGSDRILERKQRNERLACEESARVRRGNEEQFPLYQEKHDVALAIERTAAMIAGVLTVRIEAGETRSGENEISPGPCLRLIRQVHTACLGAIRTESVALQKKNGTSVTMCAVYMKKCSNLRAKERITLHVH